MNQTKRDRFCDRCTWFWRHGWRGRLVKAFAHCTRALVGTVDLPFGGASEGIRQQKKMVGSDCGRK